jgi:hypothetical protein
LQRQAKFQVRATATCWAGIDNVLLAPDRGACVPGLLFGNVCPMLRRRH